MRRGIEGDIRRCTVSMSFTFVAGGDVVNFIGLTSTRWRPRPSAIVTLRRVRTCRYTLRRRIYPLLSEFRRLGRVGRGFNASCSIFDSSGGVSLLEQGGQQQL